MVKSWQKYVAEMLGTFILVFGGSLAILAAAGANNLAVAFGFGIALLGGLYAFGEVSGGHFNPIVSLAMFLDRRLSALDTIWYWIAQFVGAILASLGVLVIFASRDEVKATATTTSSDARAFFLELIFSAIFVAVILQVTRSDRYGASALMAIPLTLFSIHVALIPFTGSSVNPARTFGPDLVGATGWSTIWIYLHRPAGGGGHRLGSTHGHGAGRHVAPRAISAAQQATCGRSSSRDVRQGPGQVPPPPSPDEPDNPQGPGQV